MRLFRAVSSLQLNCIHESECVYTYQTIHTMTIILHGAFGRLDITTLLPLEINDCTFSSRPSGDSEQTTDAMVE